jgi:hypothetical protein
LKKEWKSISIDKEIYKKVKNIQDELIKINDGDYVEISKVAEIAILEGLDKVVRFYTTVNKE